MNSSQYARYRMEFPARRDDVPYRFLGGPQEAACWNKAKCFPLNRGGVPWPFIMEQLKEEHPYGKNTYSIIKLAGLFYDIEQQQQLEGQRPLVDLLFTIINIDLEMQTWSRGCAKVQYWYPDLPMALNPTLQALLHRIPEEHRVGRNGLHKFVDYFGYIIEVNRLDDRDYILLKFQSPRRQDGFSGPLFLTDVDRARYEASHMPEMRRGFSNHQSTRPVLRDEFLY